MSYLCPICCKVTKDKNYYEDHYLLESESICEEGHYSYDFSYGSYCEVIGKNEWFWAHTETKQEELIRKKQRNVVIYEIIKGNLDFVIDQSDKEFSWKKYGF